MPLISSKSKKAFKENVETEMKAHPDKRAQNLAIAYSVKRKAAKKKMAEGGKVNADDKGKNDKHELSVNSGNKASKDDSFTDNSTVTQAQKPSRTPLSQPRMAKITGPFSVRNRDMHEDEADIMKRLPPSSDLDQPPRRDDEEDAEMEGSSPDMADQHDNHRAPYNKAIEDQYAQDVAAADMNKRQSYAAGGSVRKPKDHGDELMEREDEAHLESTESPSEDEGLEDAESLDEEDKEASGPDTRALHMKMMARGGETSPEPEEHEEMAASIASAIMSKLKAAAMMDSGSEDEDEAERMAEGGEAIGKSDSLFDVMNNNKEEPNFYPPRNGAVLKENYNEDMEGIHQPEDSNEHADSREEDSENEDDKSIVSSIRRKMRIKSAIIK